MVRGLAPHPQRRYSSGSYPAASSGDENAPPRDGFGFGFGAAPCTSTSGPTGRRRRVPAPLSLPHTAATGVVVVLVQPGKPQVPVPAPTPKNGSGVSAAGKTALTPAARPGVARRASLDLGKRPGSGVSAAGNTPARRSVARTSLHQTKKPSSSLVTRSLDLPSFNVKDSISFWEGEVNHKNSSSKCVPATPANLEACSDEGFMRNTERKLSLELEWDILKTILVEELKSCAEVEGRAAALDDELKAANFHILEACRQKEAIQVELNDTREALESNLLDSIQESNELKKANDKSLELLKERDMEMQRLNRELEKATFDRKYQQDYVSRQVEFQTEQIIRLTTEQSAIQLQLEASKSNELLAKRSLGEIELLLDEAIETIVQKEVLAQNYASLLELQQEQSKSYYEGRLKELEIRMQEMNDQVVASLISRNKEIRKTHAEEKNEILKKNEVLEISIEDSKVNVYSLEERVHSLEEEANKFKEEAQQQRRQREKLEVELHNLRQQSLVARSSGKAESSFKDGMTDLDDSTRVLSYRNNELLSS